MLKAFLTIAAVSILMALATIGLASLAAASATPETVVNLIGIAQEWYSVSPLAVMGIGASTLVLLFAIIGAVFYGAALLVSDSGRG